MFAQRLASEAGYIIAVMVAALTALAYCRVRLSRQLEEATARDGGEYWRSLPWEARRAYLRRLAWVGWGFTILFLGALFLGAWAQWFSQFHSID